MGAELDALAEKAASRFLQNVIFIDDGIEFGGTEAAAVEALKDPVVELNAAPPQERAETPVPTEAANPSTRDSTPAPTIGNADRPKEPADAAEIKAGPSASTVKASKPTNAGIDVNSLVAGFARRRILCSAINPLAGEHPLTEEELANVCASADIVILDWNLQSDDGVRTKALIARILRQSRESHPHQQRLIVIYTDSPNLENVGAKLVEHLRAAQFTVGNPNPGRYTIDSSAIAVFGKRQPHSQAVPGAKMYTGEELPQSAVTEFAHLANGIVPSMILTGLAAVRKNTSKVMRTFSPNLDLGFMLHRALVKDLEPAEDHIREVLADELAAALEEDWPQELEDAVATEFGLGMGEIVQKWANLFGVTLEEAKAIRTRFIASGYSGIRPDEVGDNKGTTAKFLRVTEGRVGPQRSQDEEALKTFLNSLSPEAKKSSTEFAALLSSTRHYNSNPYLTLGTIVRFDNPDPVIALCLQPVCDALRLTPNVPSPFPFIKLTKGAGPLCFSVGIDGAVLETFGTAGKPKDQFTESFLTNETVISAQKVDDRREFRLALVNGVTKLGFTRCTYLCQLKRAQAQRVAEKVGSMQSRVGLTESEWLRLQSRGPA